MVEKFMDYEGTQYISEEGTFVFTIENAELMDSKNGTPMWKFDVKAPEGSSTIYHSLNPKARWSFNNLIKACMHLDTAEKREQFTLDYETIGRDLIGTTFLGTVEKQVYTKEVKILQDDGTFKDGFEEKESYKIVKYDMNK